MAMAALQIMSEMAQWSIDQKVAEYVNEVVDSFNPAALDDKAREAIQMEVTIRKLSGVGTQVHA